MPAGQSRLHETMPTLSICFLRELGVSRKLLHDWRKAWGLHGPAGLNRKRGPKPGPRKLRPLAGPAADQPFSHLSSTEAVVSAEY